jgi:uncharacterized protein DUF4012
MPPVESDSGLPDDSRPLKPTPDPSARSRRRWPWIVAGVLVVIIGLGGWLSWKVLTVRTELTAAQTAITGLRSGGDVKAALSQIAGHAERAAVATHDPIWGAAEFLPWAGDNLRAVRLSSEALDGLAGGLAVPALEALQTDSKDPMLVRLLPVLQRAAGGIGALNKELQEVRQSPSLIAQVRTGVDQVADVVAVADPVLSLLPGMLGADGPRNYLLVAQSNAETLALGGSAASQSLIRFSDGNLKIVKQADSSQYKRGVPADVKIDKSAIDLYNEYLINNVNTSVGRPDWPTASRTIVALWNRDIDPKPVDGVISVDPLALARVMRATGPVTVDGHKLTSTNVVSFLLSKAYALYDPGAGGDADQIFKEVALAVMDDLVGGDFEPGTLLSAISESIDAGSLMLWSADPAAQELIAPWRISGILPTTNLPATTVGVFFRDASLGSKIDYYLRTESQVTSACTADGSVTYTVRVTVWLDLTRKQAEKLPPYVTGGELSTKTFRTQVFIYGPPGTKVGKEIRERGTGKSWNWRPLDMTDLGRPVPSFMTVNPLGGGKVSVGVTFTGPNDARGPLQVRTTPMVNPTKTTIEDGCAGR